MIAASHTPGPWGAAGNVGHGIWITSGDGSQVAVVYGPGVTAGAEANACLITAAPELLNYARAAWHLCQSLLAMRDGASDELIQTTIECLGRTIAKAEGRS